MKWMDLKMTVNESTKKFFANRRSVSVKWLKGPGPREEEIAEIIKSALRVPDHGKLEPWRAVLISEESKNKFLTIVENRAQQLSIDPGKLKKNRENLLSCPLIITIICSPKRSEKIPEIEQILSAGALCLNVLNNFLASGWGGNWLTGWMAHDRKFGEQAFNLSADEFVAGYIYVGSYDQTLTERPRPAVADKVSWF